MPARRAVVDTNVIVSGVITRNRDAPPRRVLAQMLAGEFPFVLSSALLAEYRDVLLRPELRSLHGLKERDVDILLTEITANAMLREPPAGPAAPDPGDDHLWALLASEKDTVLVTGDRRLLERPLAAGRVVTPAAFVESRK